MTCVTHGNGARLPPGTFQGNRPEWTFVRLFDRLCEALTPYFPKSRKIQDNTFPGRRWLKFFSNGWNPSPEVGKGGMQVAQTMTHELT
jgi:hypothetical protein